MSPDPMCRTIKRHRKFEIFETTPATNRPRRLFEGLCGWIIICLRIPGCTIKSSSGGCALLDIAHISETPMPDFRCQDAIPALQCRISIVVISFCNLTEFHISDFPNYPATICQAMNTPTALTVSACIALPEKSRHMIPTRTINDEIPHPPSLGGLS